MPVNLLILQPWKWSHPAQTVGAEQHCLPLGEGGDGKPCDPLAPAFSWRALLTFQPGLGSGGNGPIPHGVRPAVWGGSGEQPRAASTAWLLCSPRSRDASGRAGPQEYLWEFCLLLLQALTA